MTQKRIKKIKMKGYLLDIVYIDPNKYPWYQG